MGLYNRSPKTRNIGIGLAITLAIGTVIGILDHGQIAFAGAKGGINGPTR
jgi:hypothetical protein